MRKTFPWRASTGATNSPSRVAYAMTASVRKNQAMPIGPRMRERCTMFPVYREGGNVGTGDCDGRHPLPGSCGLFRTHHGLEQQQADQGEDDVVSNRSEEHTSELQ